MKIPSSLIQNFITSEFNAKLNSSGEYVIHSPFVEDKKGKLYINKDTGQWIDFKAKGRRTTNVSSGSFLIFVKEYLCLKNTDEAIRYLVTNYNFIVEKTEEEKKIDEDSYKVLKELIIKDGLKLFNDGSKLGIWGKQAYRYVKSRKLEEEYYPTLGYVFNDNSIYNERVIIPFFEEGKMVYFISRSINPKNKLRYVNPPILDSKNYVFNIDKINEELVMCEGAMDAMSLTIDQPATCLLSADIGIYQLDKIFAKKPKRIIYVPDNDETGHIKMNNNIKKIFTYCPYSGLEMYIYNLPNGIKDLNELKIKTGKNYILRKECSKYTNWGTL